MTETLFLRTWDERQGRDVLESKKSELGSRAFARGFQQMALSDAEKLFPHFSRCLIPGADPWDLITREWMTVAGLDLSGKSRRGSCLMVLAVSPDRYRIRVPVSVKFGAWDAPQIAEELVGAIRIWGIRHTKIEDNSLQSTIIELLDMVAPGLELSGFTTSWNKRDPEIGLPSLDKEFEADLWRIPDPEHGRGDCDFCTWKSQMLSYPAVASADGVMSTWFAREAVLELGPGLDEVLGDDVLDPTQSPWKLSRRSLGDGPSRWAFGGRSWRTGRFR